MQLRCPQCHAAIPAADVNLDLVVAKCVVCNNVFSFADKFGLPPADKPSVEQPKGFRVENWGPDLTIRYRWYTHAAWFMVLFCAFWNGIIAAFYSAVISNLLDGKFGTIEIVMLLFPIIHALVGVGLTYACLAMFLNKTTLCVARGELRISHGPLPSGRTIAVPAPDIRQLYCVKKEHRHENSTSYTYEVNALLQTGVSQTLLKNIPKYEWARYIEQQLEQHLAITDQPVGEEANC